MGQITFTRTSKPAAGSVISTPFGPKTLTEEDVASIPAVVTTETVDGDFSALTGSTAAPVQTLMTPTQLAAQYPVSELIAAIGIATAPKAT